MRKNPVFPAISRPAIDSNQLKSAIPVRRDNLARGCKSSFYWHPDAIDPRVDDSKVPPTLVEFTLERTAKGTLSKVTESGFKATPAAPRGGVPHELWRPDGTGELY